MSRIRRRNNHLRRSRRTKQQIGNGFFKRVRNKASFAKKTTPKNGNQKKPVNNNKFDLHGSAMPIIKTIFGDRGMVPPGYKYLGPGNELSKQLVINREKGTIKKYLKKPTNKLDKIASKHDVCYQLGRKSKNQCDLEMLKEMKSVANQTGIMGKIAKVIISGKYKLRV